ncbi:hypothetical protein ACWFRN_31470, partial [Streptomyces celluloflavus]
AKPPQDEASAGGPRTPRGVRRGHPAGLPSRAWQARRGTGQGENDGRGEYGGLHEHGGRRAGGTTRRGLPEQG